MTWFKVDDGFWSHPKTVGLSAEAVALWVRAGSYCGQHLTDGVVPRHLLTMLQGTTAQADELMAAGLWLDDPEGYLFHDWHTYQPTRTKVENERAKTRERVAKHRESKTSPSFLDSSRPVPSRPGYGVSNAVTPEQRFDEFWQVYPRKAGKAAAKTAWVKATEKQDPDLLISAAKTYRDDPNREDGFTAHASTWLNQERWEDEPLPRRGTQRITRLAADLAALTDQPALEAEAWN